MNGDESRAVTIGRHDGRGGGAAPARYAPIVGRASASEAPMRAFRRVSALVGGSRRVFPAKLSRALDALRLDPFRRDIPIEHALRFFGGRLILDIQPSRLTHRLMDQVTDGRAAHRLSDWFLDSADWADIREPLEISMIHREMFQVVEFGADYRDTPAFNRLRRIASEGNPAKRFDVVLDSEAKIEAYFVRYSALAEGIRRVGLRRRSAIRGSEAAKGFRVRGRHAFIEREIGVAIDRDGALLRFLGGHHRTAIAQALGLPTMPVEVRMVHADWLRAEAERSGRPPEEALVGWIDRIRGEARGTPVLDRDSV